VIRFDIFSRACYNGVAAVLCGTTVHSFCSQKGEETMAQESSSPPAGGITENDRLMALLAYIIGVIVPIVILVSEENKNRPFQRYHAIHSLGLWVASLIYSVVACIVYFLLTTITLGILGLCLWIIFLLPLVPVILYGIKAYQGEWVVIPVVTDFIKGQGWV
jgi:uncharacterized membrane protein